MDHTLTWLHHSWLGCNVIHEQRSWRVICTQILHDFHCIVILPWTGDSEGCSSFARRMKQSAVLLRVPFGLFRLFSTWTSRVQCQEKRISQFQNPLARLEARCSASINGISLCGLGAQKLYNGENAAF